MTATDQLDRDIRERVLMGDADTIVRMLELTRNLNTALEIENQALREFVEAYDAHEVFRVTVPEDGMELWVAEWEHLMVVAKQARQRLATDHNLPLPGDRRTGADAAVGR